MSVRNPHDRFFRDSFSRPEIIRDFIKEYLPPAIRDGLDVESLLLEDGSFIDEEMQQQHSDTLYAVQRIDSSAAYLYLLFEHKSYPDSEVAWQLMRYMVRIWSDAPRDEGRFRPIIPLVIYHGERPWRVSAEFQSLFTLDDAWKPHVPQFSYLLYDFSHLSNEAIRGEIWLRVCLTTLRTIFDPQLREQLPALLDLAFKLHESTHGLDYIRLILYYFSTATEKVSKSDMRTALKAQLEKGQKVMATIAEEYRQEGREQGREEGLEIGRAQTARLFAKRALKLHDVVTVSELTGLTIVEVEQIAKEID